ncbi:hypothetical protein B0T16DRAFT_384155 [Cercophora newfieldiana]|uniref:Uncharacterized protein n=1 Tax=Cercophora newfieldiana TaxID=92897 RepID=A0AA40CXN9_9PEZI|nr:hypothetical protein B0T16DRAFT_384155 [Cercophora newfieldiana]
MQQSRSCRGQDLSPSLNLFLSGYDAVEKVLSAGGGRDLHVATDELNVDTPGPRTWCDVDAVGHVSGRDTSPLAGRREVPERLRDRDKDAMLTEFPRTGASPSSRSCPHYAASRRDSRSRFSRGHDDDDGSSMGMEKRDRKAKRPARNRRGDRAVWASSG